MNENDQLYGSISGNRLWPEDLLGLQRQNVASLIQAVDKGFSFDSIESMQRTTGLTVDSLATAIGMRSATLSRRRKENRLTPLESDRLLAVAYTVTSAIELFGGKVESARNWMLKPIPALGNSTPIEKAGTEIGRWELNNLIDRLKHGIFN